MKDSLFDIFEEKRKAELNLYSNALKRLQKENLIFKQAEERYAEFVHNQYWRSWIGTDYEKIIKEFAKKSNENYNNQKVFDEISKLDKYNYIYDLFAISKEIIEWTEPKTIGNLANILALGRGSTGEYILTLAQMGGFKTKFLKNITKNTYNLILYTEQLKKALNKIYNDKDEADFIYKILYDIRYSCDLIEILKLCRKKNFSILNHIKKENIIDYTNYLKIAYTSLKDALGDMKDEEFKAIINSLLLGVMISCKKSEAIRCAKKLYEFASHVTK